MFQASRAAICYAFIQCQIYLLAQKMKHLNEQRLIAVRQYESLSIRAVGVGCTTLNEARTPGHMAEVEI